MSEEQEARKAVEQWVEANVVPMIVQMLSATGYVRDEPVTGAFGSVRLQRTTSGQVRITCSRHLIVEALTSLLGEKYLVQHTHRSNRAHIVYITPKSMQE